MLNAWGFSVTNNFNITTDQLCIWRGNSVPLLYLDIEEGVPHSYRVEHYGDHLYAHYVDEVLVDSGKPLGDFPNASARIIWGSRMWMTPSTNEWDYVRYGRIPQDASGDFDSDGDVDVDDHYASSAEFVVAFWLG